MTELQVLTAPPLARIPGIELMHVGQWDLSTGPMTATADDLAFAVAALECPAIRRPILKLGHVDPRFDGEPCVGWVDNMGVQAGGSVLVGDFAGMPGWLGQIIASAYPDRSVEGAYDKRCQLGHTHPFVITAVSLLGVTAPGIGTLASLQDVGALYGVVAASDPRDHEIPFNITVHAAQEEHVPNPEPRKVAASVTTDDVRRAYYEIAPWSVWIEEFHLDTLQLLTIDDDSREWFLVPIIIGDGEGEDAVSFGDPQPVKRTFVAITDVAAASNTDRVVYASRSESRLGVSSPTAPAASADGPATTGGATTQKEVGMPDTLLDGLRQQLGLPAEADEAAILAANQAALTELEKLNDKPDEAPVVAPIALPDGTVAVDSETWETTVAAAQAGAQAREEQLTARREQLVAAALADGRISKAREEHWLTSLTADPGSEAVLASLKPGTVPLTEIGHAGNDEQVSASAIRDTETYKNWSMA